MAQTTVSVVRRAKTSQRSFEERPPSLELETHLSSTETKIVVLDFLSSQPIDPVRSTKRKASDERSKYETRRKSLGKSSSDATNYDLYRSRSAKLAKTGQSLRKQYSLRLQKDLDNYMKRRGKSMDDVSKSWGSASSQNEGEGVYLHQRSHTEGEADYKMVAPASSSSKSPAKRHRKITRELQKGIKEFKTEDLRHVDQVSKENTAMSDDVRSEGHRPASLAIPRHQERRLSPVLSPESQVAARLELISQEILTKYPDFFEEQISRVSLQDLTYEKFASIARKVLDKYPGGWTRIALVCYFARELALDDESSDEELDNLVNFSSKFISETSAEWIASRGGWGALEDDYEILSASKVRQKLREPDVVDSPPFGQSGRKWLDFLKYGFAALAVGVTVAYNVAK